MKKELTIADKLRKKYHKCEEINNFKDILHRAETIFRTRIAFKLKDEKGNIYNKTYEDLKKDVTYLGTSLIEKGLLNKRIAVIGKNSYNWAISYLAASIVGIVVPIDKELHSNDIINFMNASESMCILGDGKNLKQVIEDIDKLENKDIIFINFNEEIKDNKFLSFKMELEKGKQYFRNKNTGRLFIAYFQAYTNTYAPLPKLETLYREALNEPSVVGISIATRPDCLDQNILCLLDRLNKEYPDKLIWIELGLQTIHERTAILIRRGYSLEVFEHALTQLQKISIPVIVHVILGLPGETKEMMLETCRFLAAKKVNGVKLQLLHVLKNTDLVELYEKKTFEILGFMEYIDIIISCLELLPPDIVIHRITGDGPKNLLIAPLWSLDKRRVLNTLHQELKRRGTWQGKVWNLWYKNH